MLKVPFSFAFLVTITGFTMSTSFAAVKDIDVCAAQNHMFEVDISRFDVALHNHIHGVSLYNSDYFEHRFKCYLKCILDTYPPDPEPNPKCVADYEAEKDECEKSFKRMLCQIKEMDADIDH